MTIFSSTARRAVLKIIKVYQKTLSFDHGFFAFLFPHGFCRFNPTCSEYGYAAILKYGIFRGGVKAFWRVLRCNPFSRGGFDPLK